MHVIFKTVSKPKMELEIQTTPLMLCVYCGITTPLMLCVYCDITTPLMLCVCIVV